MKTRVLLPIALAAISVILMPGCASFNRIANYPTPDKATTVRVVPKPLSKMNELPLGAYYDEQRQIVVTGHQKGVGVGMMFGLVGVLVANSANQSSAASQYGDAARAGSDLVSLTEASVKQALADNRAPRWTLATAPAGDLLLSPYAIFTVQVNGNARLCAMLRAEILGHDGNPVWSARYFARAPGEYPINGDAGWMKGARFATGMRQALDRAVGVCIDDSHGRLAGMRTVTAEGPYPYVNTGAKLRAIVVAETPDAVVARLAVGDVIVFAGTHVLDRADYKIVDADFRDPRK